MGLPASSLSVFHNSRQIESYNYTFVFGLLESFWGLYDVRFIYILDTRRINMFKSIVPWCLYISSSKNIITNYYTILLSSCIIHVTVYINYNITLFSISCVYNHSVQCILCDWLLYNMSLVGR